jgi:hypothetical protein
LGFGSSSGEKVLENKAFSRTGAAEGGDFTPNMGYRLKEARKRRRGPGAGLSASTVDEGLKEG